MIIGDLQILARDPAEPNPRTAHEHEWAAIFAIFRRLANDLSVRAVEYPQLVRTLIGGDTVLDDAPLGLAFVDETFTLVSHSGEPAWQQEWDRLRSLDHGLPLVTLVVLQGPAGEEVRVVLANLETLEGSILQKARAAMTGASATIVSAFLGALFAAVAGTPEVLKTLDFLSADKQYEYVWQKAELEGSVCVEKVSFTLNVEALRGLANDTYDYEAAEDEGERRRRICNLQVALKVLGYPSFGKVDGIFGPKTAAAWDDFRRDHELPLGDQRPAHYHALAYEMTRHLDHCRREGLPLKHPG